MTYQPDPVIQGDGSTFAWENCTAASAATSVDRDTEGKHRTTGAIVRAYTGDRSGGLNLAEVDAALQHQFPPEDHLDTRYMIAFDDLIQEVSDGRGALVQGGYRVFAGTALDGSPGFTGNHCCYLNDVAVIRRIDGTIDYDRSIGEWWDPLWDGRRPSIPDRRMRWIPLREIRAFAGALNLGSSEVGMGSAYAALTRDTTPLAPKPDVTGIEFGRNTMIVAGGIEITSSHTMALPKTYPLRDSPSPTGRIVTKMAAAGNVPYTGHAGSGWNTVVVKTGNFPDKVARVVQLYVPSGAGTVARAAATAARKPARGASRGDAMTEVPEWALVGSDAPADATPPTPVPDSPPTDRANP